MQTRLFIEVLVLKSERLMRVPINPLVLFQMAFAYPSAQGIVAVHPSFFRTIFFKEFRFNQLVMRVVEVVLHFSVG